jgi:hypothetical protein
VQRLNDWRLFDGSAKQRKVMNRARFCCSYNRRGAREAKDSVFLWTNTRRMSTFEKRSLCLHSRTMESVDEQTNGSRMSFPVRFYRQWFEL